MIAWDEHSTRDAYDTVADTYADHFTSTESELPVDLAMIDHFIAQVAEPKRVLDAGCGAGRMMPYLATRGCVVEGLDLSSEMVRRAQRDHPEFHVRVGSLVQLPYPDASFDGVMSWYSTIHSPDDQIPGMLREMRRVVRPGGVVLLGFQVGQETREVAGGYRRRGHEVTLVRYSRTVRWMAERLQGAQLEPIASLERAADLDERDRQGMLVARATSAHPAH